MNTKPSDITVRFIPANATGLDRDILDLMCAPPLGPRLTGEQADDAFAKFLGEAISKVITRGHYFTPPAGDK